MMYMDIQRIARLPGAVRGAAHDDRLGVCVEVQRLGAVLLAVAAALESSERQLVIDLGARIDPRVAAIQLGGGVLGAVQIGCPRPTSRGRTAQSLASASASSRSATRQIGRAGPNTSSRAIGESLGGSRITVG